MILEDDICPICSDAPETATHVLSQLLVSHRLRSCRNTAMMWFAEFSCHKKLNPTKVMLDNNVHSESPCHNLSHLPSYRLKENRRKRVKTSTPQAHSLHLQITHIQALRLFFLFFLFFYDKIFTSSLHQLLDPHLQRQLSMLQKKHKFL